MRKRIDGVMDGCRYSNSVIARAATDFYLNGIPAGVVSRSLGVNKGTLLGAFARVAEALEPARAKACSIISSAEFAQGDESRWRIDGRNGYAWVFMAGNLVVFACADSRGSAVAAERLEHALDRYARDKSTDMFEALFGGLDLKLPVLPRGVVRRLPKAITGK